MINNGSSGKEIENWCPVFLSLFPANLTGKQDEGTNSSRDHAVGHNSLRSKRHNTEKAKHYFLICRVDYADAASAVFILQFFHPHKRGGSMKKFQHDPYSSLSVRLNSKSRHVRQHSKVWETQKTMSSDCDEMTLSGPISYENPPRMMLTSSLWAKRMSLSCNSGHGRERLKSAVAIVSRRLSSPTKNVKKSTLSHRYGSSASGSLFSNNVLSDNSGSCRMQVDDDKEDTLSIVVVS